MKFDGRLCDNYSHQKLLKSANPPSS